jgi:hypothetical protein
MYCGSSKNEMTKEHVIANWTRKYLGRNVKAHGKMSVTIDNPGVPGEQVTSYVKKVDGDPRARQVRQVCKICNGGWMKEMQDAAKPIALPIILGGRAVLSAVNQKTLVIWILMTVMTSEFSDAEFAGIPDSDRRFL